MFQSWELKRKSDGGGERRKKKQDVRGMYEDGEEEVKTTITMVTTKSQRMTSRKLR